VIPIEDCPDCGASLEVPKEHIGMRVECPDCRNQFLARAVRRVRREEDDLEDRPRQSRRRSRRQCPECAAAVSARERYCPECDAELPQHLKFKEANSKKITAGICGILIGGLGIHKFLLGYTTAGVVMLLVSLLTCGFGALVMHVIGIIEGIMYLTKSDEDFYRIYVEGQKEWF
jgi:TM2 domain-containing membrane protein YozV/DNA-directed RNA polymerase subunit M/transcription elongation factor TFIIS